MSELYNIRRFYENENRSSRIMARGLDLAEARAWCSRDDTSSYTAPAPLGCENNPDKIARWHEKKLHWFDGFERA